MSIVSSKHVDCLQTHLRLHTCLLTKSVNLIYKIDLVELIKNNNNYTQIDRKIHIN